MKQNLPSTQCTTFNPMQAKMMLTLTLRASEPDLCVCVLLTFMFMCVCSTLKTNYFSNKISKCHKQKQFWYN